MADSVQNAVLGVGGYAGVELARLLLHHPRLKGQVPIFLGRPESNQDVPLTALHP
jgi:N-acetyl-gamma-glutamyl-phosphate reductase